MAKRMLIDAAHPEETRVVVLNGHRLEEFDFESSTKKQIKGNIYLAKVTRVEPSLQAAFVEYGGNRHGFLAFNEIHPDYYRIPVGDRRAQEARDARARELAEDARRAEAADAAGDAPEELRSEDEVPAEPAYGDSPGAEPDDAAAMPAEATRQDVLYDDDHGREEDPPLPEPAAAHSAAEPHRAPENEPPAEDHERGHEHDGGHDGQHEAEEAAAPHEAHDHGAPELLAEDGRAAPVETIETVGGDETEETPRQRVRPFRHYKIQEVVKRRQIMLVQVTKEERGNKGAALTTFLSLAGRYCVLMPNTPRGGGVSRKITSAADRRRLKDLMSDLDVPEGMGVIVRTAGSERSKTEIKRDFEYLMRLWDEIRDLTLKSTAPTLIYEEGNLIKRAIRDLYARDIDEVIIDGEEGHRTAKAFMKMLMPSHAKRIKLYGDPTVPLFHRFQVETQIDAIHSPVVQLRSGGYIVINPTEALVSIDVNSGRSTRERNIEETALKTNIEAAEEIARQLRLRDLAGLIVIDFIDMEEHRNQAAVERKIKEAMRHDRARIQLGRISLFGLLEMSRQRLRPSLLEASTQPCPHCNGTGHIRSTESTALHVLRAIEEEGMRRRSAEISVAAPTAVALYILNHKRESLVQAEARCGFRVTIGGDDTLVPPAFRLERLRALTPAEIAALPAPVAPVAQPDDDDDGVEDEDAEIEAETHTEVEGEPAAAPAMAPSNGDMPRAERPAGDDGHGRRRRRRRRRGGRREDGREGAQQEGSAGEASPREGMPMMPPPLHDVTAPMDDLADDESEQPETEPQRQGGGGGPQHPASAEHNGEQGGRKRRRRGRRGGRRRRGNGEPKQDGPPLAADHQDPSAPIAEQVEYVPPPSPPPEEVVRDMEAALGAAPAPAAEESGAESLPIADRGDHAPAPSSQPAPEPPREVASTPPPVREATEAPANPKRGWWRRVMDS